MGKRQKQWAVRARADLVQLLGGRCVECGTTEELHLDCILPQGHHHHKLDSSSRVSFYRRQHAEGNLQVLCAACNGRKGALDDKWESDLADAALAEQDAILHLAPADHHHEQDANLRLDPLPPPPGGKSSIVREPLHGSGCEGASHPREKAR